MNLAVIVECFMNEKQRCRFNELWSLVNKCHEAIDYPFCKLRDIDVEALKQAQYAQRVPDYKNVNMFLVAEPTKKRSIIAWPKASNAAMNEVKFLETLETPFSIIKDVKGGQYALSLDLTISFNQVELQQEFVFEHQGAKYCLSRLIMGHKLAPELMQLLVTAITNVSLDQHHQFSRNVHIDNVRFLSERKETLQLIREILMKRFERAKVTINEKWAEVIKTRDEYYGLEFDYARAIYRIAESKIPALKHMLNVLHQPMSLRNSLGIFAKLFLLCKSTAARP